ncbi:hypothetical protein Agub_g9974, partial [Astrephomene gubernaculifera]
PGVAHTLQVTLGLLECLGCLLSGGSTSPVPLPGQGVVLAAMRLLKLEPQVLLAPGRVAPSSSAQAEVLTALPELHSAAWGLLGLTCRLLGPGGVMPLTAPLCRLVSEQLRRIKAGGAGGLACTMHPSVRTKLYDTTVVVLRTCGFAAGRALATEVVGMLVTELYGLSAVQQQQQQQQQAALYGSGAAGAAFGKAG